MDAGRHEERMKKIMSSIFTARGQEAKQSIEKKNVDLKNVYYRFKSGEGAKVRVLSTFDYVEYLAHSSFTHRIFTQSCISVLGEECPLCKASKSGIEGYEALSPRKRYVFVFADMVSGELKALDVSKNQAKAIIASIEEYGEDINDLAFNLKKVGEGTNTGYSLSPIIKMKGDDLTQFEKCGGLTVEDSFFETILSPRSIELQVGVLKESGFPTDEYFPNVILEDRKDLTPEEQEDLTKNF